MSLEMRSLLHEVLAEERGEAEGHERSKVVVVDDDTSIRNVLGSVLEGDYEVSVCATAEEGVAAVNEDTSAVVLDVKMKGNDGFWACRAIRLKSPFLPVIFYSAYQNVKNPYDVINEFQPFGYVMKGADVEILLNTIERAVKSYKRVRDNNVVITRLRAIEIKMQSLRERIAEAPSPRIAEAPSPRIAEAPSPRIVEAPSPRTSPPPPRTNPPPPRTNPPPPSRTNPPPSQSNPPSSRGAPPSSRTEK